MASDRLPKKIVFVVDPLCLLQLSNNFEVDLVAG